MSFFVPLIMFGWVPLILLLFMLMPARRAVVIGFVFAWLFLPNAEYRIPGLPDYTKMSATCLGVFLGGWLFDPDRRLSQWRPSMIDLPMIIFCVCPIITSITNRPLPLWHGLASMTEHLITWGIPYYLGRVYFSDLLGLDELGKGMILGGFAYVPLCLLEVRISPRLHKIVYGFKTLATHKLTRSAFGGLSGYRPQVFMINGLMCGMWMSASTLLTFAFWSSGTWPRLRWYHVGLIAGTLVLCKAVGALVLCVGGIGLLIFCRRFQMRWPLIALILLTPLYIVTRSTDVWDGQNLVQFVSETLNPRRAQSLEFRFQNETLLADHAWKRSIFGWGGYSRAIPRDPDTGEKATVADGFWIITFGQYGLTGMISFYLILLLPAYLIWRHLPVHLWSDSRFAPLVALALLSSLYSLDCLLNAMINPVFMLGVGGTTGCTSALRALFVGAPEPSNAPQASLAT